MLHGCHDCCGLFRVPVILSGLVVFVLIVVSPFAERYAVSIELWVANHEFALPQQAHHMPLEPDERLGLVVGADLVKRDAVRSGPEARLGNSAHVLAAAVAGQAGSYGLNEVGGGSGLLGHALSILPAGRLTLSSP